MTTCNQCGCKGTRTCLICESRLQIKHIDKERTTGVVCWYCNEIKEYNEREELSKWDSIDYWKCLNCTTQSTAEPLNPSLTLSCNKIRQWWENAVGIWNDGTDSILDTCAPPNANFGVLVVPNVLSKEEEQEITSIIDSESWWNSQSGRRKQDYGVVVNFKKQKIKTDKFTGLPPFAEKFLIPKYTSTGPDALIKTMEGFEAVELCNLEYSPERGSQIEPHFDDSWIWGRRLITFNLLSSTFLTFSPPNIPIDLKIPLPRRSIVVVNGPSRIAWLHSIYRQDIKERRIAITLRELASSFLHKGEQEEIGKLILEVARTFKGRPINFS